MARYVIVQNLDLDKRLEKLHREDPAAFRLLEEMLGSMVVSSDSTSQAAKAPSKVATEKELTLGQGST